MKNRKSNKIKINLDTLRRRLITAEEDIVLAIESDRPSHLTNALGQLIDVLRDLIDATEDLSGGNCHEGLPAGLEGMEV